MSDTIFSPFAETNQDDTVTTMGGLGGLPAATNEPAFNPASYLSREMPQLDFTNFLGTASQIAQLFPGVQTKPTFTPGLTDISMTRGFYGPGEDVSPEQYGSGGPGTLFWERGGMGGLPTFQAETTTTASVSPEGPDPFGESALRAALGMDWSGVYQDRLRELEAQRPVTNITNTNTFTPTFNPSNINTNTNTNTQSQNQSQTQTQQQSQGGGTTQSQTQDKGGTTTGGGTKTTGGTTTTGGGTKTGGGLDDIPFQADLGRLDLEDDTTKTNLDDIPFQADLGRLDEDDTTPTPKRELTADQRIVNDIYKDVLGREAEAAGLDYWDDRLAAGVTPDQLRREIRAGAQNTDIEAVKKQDDARAIEQIYQDLLGRSAEPAALEFWGKQLEQGTPVTTLVDRIAAGAQNADVGAVQKANVKAVADEAFVRDSYRNLYGREASEAEVNYHTDAMNRGLAREQFVNNMFVGGQGADATNLGQYREQASQLNNFVSDFSKGIQTTAGAISGAPEVVREEFVKQLATANPELFQSFFGDSVSGAAKTISEGFGAAGNVIGVAQALLSADSVSDAAGNLVEVFGRQALAEGASMAMTALGIPVVGPVVSAAIMLDGFLSKAFGYDSPIQDAVGWLSGITEDVVGGVGEQVEKAAEWVSNQSKNLFSPKKWSFQEGGLVDMPDDMEYNYGDYYGSLDDLPEDDDVLPPMAFAGGGLIPLVGGGKVAMGPGGGLDDLIPTSIDGRRAAALSDGEFVIPADVVSMMGDGSTNAGSRRLYDLVRQIRQEKTGTSKQAGPLPVGKILERTMR